MRIFSAVAVVVLLTGPAYAQMPKMNLLPEAKSLTPEEKEAEAAKDRAYKESLRKIPDAKASSDPWGTVRNGDAAKDAAKDTPKASAKPRTKTGSTAN
jgi:hypothetical protein